MAEDVDDLDTAADDVVQVLRWQLEQLRSTYLSGDGFDARRRVAAARGRVFTLVSGVKDADVTVVSRMVQLATGTTNADDPSSPELDAGLQQAIASWRAMDPPDYWDTATAYVRTTNASIAEQVLLLTYLALVVTDARPPTAGTTPVELLAGVTRAWAGDEPDQLYPGCAGLTLGGADAPLAFGTEVALLVLAAITLPDE